MDAGYIVRWPLVIILIVSVFSFPSYAGQTFSYSSIFDLPIPMPGEPDVEAGKGWMAEATIDINEHCIIDDLDIFLDLIHENFFDLQISLKSPVGTEVVLTTSGNLAWLNISVDRQIIFDDEALTSVADMNALLTRLYYPHLIVKTSSAAGQ